MRNSHDLLRCLLLYTCPIITVDGYVQQHRPHEDMTTKCSNQMLRFGSHHQGKPPEHSKITAEGEEDSECLVEVGEGVRVSIVL